ncbi:nucleotide exchange factor GrpE [Gryllotalpicola sp.]|uniref:nucleotide exchange factor GrpE n=1 Tax=Gryllotalpicola sp. TaxID=1932787 RepID=UPI0026045D28|nr:nucleotide exchange factor GrpE [Gryllotalpicola sp.]
MNDKDEEHEEPVVRDKRRIDPETGEARHPEGAGSTESAPEGDEELFVDDILAAAEQEADDPSSEHLADLKRITAEYANYRKRTEANREVERERAVKDAVTVILPVVDDLDRAQKHGDLDGDSAFSTIAAKLRDAIAKLGLTPYGEVGDVFDPQRHQAIFQQPVPGATETTVIDVVEVGYTLGSTQVRPAKVVVATPEQ